MPECLICSSPEGLPAKVYICSGVSNVHKEFNKISFTRHFSDPTTYYICDNCFNKEKKTRLGWFLFPTGLTIVAFIFFVWMLFVSLDMAAIFGIAMLGGLCFSIVMLYRVIEDSKNIRSKLAVKNLKDKNSEIAYFTPKHYLEFKRESDKIKSKIR